VRPDLWCWSTRRASTFRSRAARRLGCPTLYYVSPQVWAWRTGRIRKLARWVNQLAVIFPFEPAVYAGTRVPVEYVGHPLVERLARVSASVDRESARRELRQPANARIVALLPGSRGSEMRHLLPLQLEVARVLHARDPRIHFVMPRAASLAREALEAGIRAARLPSLLQIDISTASRWSRCARRRGAAQARRRRSRLRADCPIVVAAPPAASPLAAAPARCVPRSRCRT
jgi:lipid-A-disaccharide synthase